MNESDIPPLPPESSKVCPSCQTKNDADSRFCESCGWEIDTPFKKPRIRVETLMMIAGIAVLFLIATKLGIDIWRNWGTQRTLTAEDYGTCDICAKPLTFKERLLYSNRKGGWMELCEKHHESRTVYPRK